MIRPGAFLRDARAATAAEFALVLPIVLLFLFGIIDVGRYTWQINQAEKAAQMGARFAVVTGMVEGGLTSASYVGDTHCGSTLTAGDPICAAALGKVSCTSTSCTPCTTAPCPTTSYKATAFNNILARIQAFAPSVAASNVTVEYSGSGLGFAGDPTIAIAPIVTIELHDMTFHSFSLLGTSFTMPTISRSQTLEDGVGTQSN